MNHIPTMGLTEKGGRGGRVTTLFQQPHRKSIQYATVRRFTFFQSPISIILALTVPKIDKDEENNNWNKWLNILHCVVSPVFLVLITDPESKHPHYYLHVNITSDFGR